MAHAAFVIESVAALAALRAEWDMLATSAEQPFSAPAWVLAWWAALGAPAAALRVVAVRNGDELVGVFPLCAKGHAYEAMGGGMGLAGPLVRPGMEAEVTAAMAEAIVSLEPRPTTIRLQQSDDSPAWADVFAENWQGRGVWRRETERVAVPGVEIGDDIDAWLAAKSSSFRREMKRKRKRLDEAGGGFRFADAETLERDLAEFLRLHRTRLAGQGGSSLTGDGVEATLLAAGNELLPEDRFRLLMLEADGKAIGAQLVLTAGSKAIAWNSGFDEDYAKLSPSMQCIFHVLGDAAEKGQRSLSLGPGDQAYKSRFADHDVERVSYTLVPRGRGYARARGKLAAGAAAGAVNRGLSTIVPQPLHRFARMPARRVP